MRIFDPNKGFSLIQALLVTGLLSALALVGTRMTSTQKTAQKAAELRGDIEVLNSLVQTILQDKKNCTANFVVGSKIAVGQTLDQIVPDKVEGDESEVVPVIKVAPPGEVPGTAFYMSNKVSIKEIKVGSLLPGGTTPETIDIVYLQHRDKLKAKEIKKSIPIRFRYEAGNFKDCYMDEMAYNTLLYKEFCQLPGLRNFFQWQSVDNTWDSLGDCVIAQRDCSAQPGTLLVGYNADGTVNCKPFSEIVPASELFDVSAVNDCVPSTSTAVKLEIIADKIKVSCEACTPTCAEMVPQTCSTVDAGTLCGETCGMGTKVCDPTCTETCAEAVAKACVGVDVGTRCGETCGVGTLPCELSCKLTQTVPTPALCIGNQYETDSYDIVDSGGNVKGSCYHEHGHPECLTGGYTNTCPAYPGCPTSTCTAQVPNTCADREAVTCTGTQAPPDGCLVPCGMGKKNCSCSSTTKPSCPAGSYEVGYGICDFADVCTRDCIQWGPSCENTLRCRYIKNPNTGVDCAIE